VKQNGSSALRLLCGVVSLLVVSVTAAAAADDIVLYSNDSVVVPKP
jgi:hypothetical protein